MDTTQKKYDLETRTFDFAKRTRSFVKQLSKSIANTEDARQLVRSSGSVGANYIEANDSLGEKDKVMRLRICKKEAKESTFWLMLIEVENNLLLEDERQALIKESQELMLIFGAIVQKLIKTKQPITQEIRIRE